MNSYGLTFAAAIVTAAALGDRLGRRRIYVVGGPLVGGVVVQGLDWHWIFWINVPVGLAAAALSVVKLPESRGPAGRLDLPAVPLVAGAAVALTGGLIQAGDTGWTSAKTVTMLAAGVALLVAFVVREQRTAAPMLPLRLFRSVPFAAANGAAFLMNAAGLAWVAGIAGTSGGYARFVLPLIVAGAGISMAIPTVIAAALGAVQPADIGRASGVVNTLQRLGGAFGIAIATAVFSAHGHLGSPAGMTAGYRPALAVAALLS